MRQKIITKEKALQRLESLCSRSEQCESDLKRKMVGWGLNPGDREEVLESLRANRYVDDSRFARSYAHYKAAFAAWGPLKIKGELIKKKIKAPVISEALKAVEQDVWKEGLLKNALAKARNLNFDGDEYYVSRRKLFQYLIGRGFPAAAATKAVQKVTPRANK